MLLEQLGKAGQGDVEDVHAIVVFETGEIGLLFQAAGLLEGTDQGLGVGIDVEGEGGEGLGAGVVEEAALLEQERGVGLATDLERRESAEGVHRVKEKVEGGKRTLSRTSLQISPEPALAMGMTLISSASLTSLALVAVKRALT